MLTRPQVMLIAGMLLLSAAAALTYIGHRARLQQPLIPRKRCRLRLSSRPLTLLRRCLFLRPDVPELFALQELGQSLTESILHLRRLLRSLPALPGVHEPHLMSLARKIAEEPSLSAACMERHLRSPQNADFTSCERLALPLCVAAAQCERLCDTLHTLWEDAGSRREGLLLAARLSRSKQPLSLLTRRPIPLTALATLLSQLRTRQQDALLDKIDEWLGTHGTDAAQITERSADRQTALTEDLHEAASRLEYLITMDWSGIAEDSDPLHALMLTDPSGVYPEMTPVSRQQYRARAEKLAQWMHTDAKTIAETALSLCMQAESPSLEQHIGWYLFEKDGLEDLRKASSLPHGRLRLFIHNHRHLILRVFLWGFSIICSVLFLNAGEPLPVLPFLLPTLGCLPRGLMKCSGNRCIHHAVQTPAITEELRTLVVLPATLRDAQDALQALRFLRTASCCFPAEGVDLLLMADYAPAITRTTGGDQAVISAAAQGTAALCSEAGHHRFLYLQRARSWLPDEHHFGARNGHIGASETVCRLVAQGECADLFDYESFSPADLHRSYSFVLVLDAREAPVPGMLEKLLSAASHPLNTRYPAVGTMRGWSCFSPSAYRQPAGSHCHTRLLRPDAFLESVDGALSDQDDDRFASDALAGVYTIPDAYVHAKPPAGLDKFLDEIRHQTCGLLRAARWMLPFSHVVGLTDRSIPSQSRFFLREELRTRLLPVCRMALLAWALLERNAVLLLLALFLPSMLAFLGGAFFKPILLLEDIVFLPSMAGAAATGIWQVLRSAIRKDRSAHHATVNWLSLELYAQGISILACLTASAANPFWFPALIPAAAFALAPLLHQQRAARLVPDKLLPSDRDAELRQIALATWRSLEGPLKPTSCPFPPHRVQTTPPVDIPPQASPASAGLYMLSLVCARELGFLSAHEAAQRVSDALTTLQHLPLDHGLPCKMYALPDLVPMDETIDTADCGLLLVSLMTCAQALRTWLPELHADLHHVPASLDEYAASLDILRLYDPAAHLFYHSLDRDGQGIGHIRYFHDASLLLSVAARARGLVSPEHLLSLSHTCVEAGDDRLPLTRYGDLAACLLPGLFLPIDGSMARRVILLHQQHGSHGMWGRSFSASCLFTPDLQYRFQTFGLREIASGEPARGNVFSPYAAALALPFAPEAALDCLTAMKETPLWSPHGFYDAIDLSQEQPQVAFTQDICHQALILCAAAHVLADAPLRRYFAELPTVQACLPLLETPASPPLLLPPRPVHPVSSTLHQLPERVADAAHLPADAHLIGSKKASILMNALGSSRIVFDGVPITSFTGTIRELEGFQVYLSIQGRVFRATDPVLPGKLTFSGGCIHAERLCGCLRVSMTILTDPAAGTIMHLMEVTNLASATCRFDVADLLPADQVDSAETMEARRPALHKLILHDRATGRKLYHQAAFSCPAEQLCVCTDMLAFTGRGRNLHQPASLEEPMADLHAASCADCLSFRAAFTLGGRTQMQLLFTTGMSDSPLPEWHELPGLISIAEMHALAISEAIPMPPAELMTTGQLAGALFWRGLPHQGTRTPLPKDAIKALSLFSPPMLTITVPDEAALPRLRKLLRAGAWYHLHGQSFTMYILCTAETEEAARTALHQSLLSDSNSSCRILTDMSPALAEALSAVSNLTLTGDGRSLSAQLAALAEPLPPHRQPYFPLPGRLPEVSLLNSGGYGGFDPDSGDYIIRLEAGQTTPIPWKMHLHSPEFCLTAEESGLLLPSAQHLTLSLNGDAPFEPLRAGLPTLIRVGHGWLRWRVYARDFILTLDVACISDAPAALHSARIRNAGQEALSVELSITADLAASPLTHLQNSDGIIIASGLSCSFLAPCSDDWAADTPASYVIPAAHTGSRVARLSVCRQLEPGVSRRAAWLLGDADSSGDAAAIQAAVQSTGISACIRSARETAVNARPALTISTPEPTLDLLVNHVLPRQVQAQGGSALITAMTDPEEGRMQFLRSTADLSTGLHTAFHTAMYLHLTGDASVLNQPFQDKDNLFSVCREALLACKTENHASSTKQLCEAMLAAAAAEILLSYTEDDALNAHRQELLHASAGLWQDDHHGTSDLVLLSVQASAALALGDTPRVHKGLNTCWDTLYDREHGLIREKLPDESPACHGTPHNGGQITASAVLYLAALIRMGHNDQAWELLRALNPLHHTDDPVRSEAFAGPPWLLPEGVHALPSSPGRASGEDAAAADLLLTLIITRFLGMNLHAGKLSMHPVVPEDWDSFAITLHKGSSTWHISMERELDVPSCDGNPVIGSLLITDDGRIHQLRLPLYNRSSSA